MRSKSRNKVTIAALSLVATKCDVYVAMNAAYADFCKHFDDAQIPQIGYDFFFADEDWDKDGKIWHYMSL